MIKILQKKKLLQSSTAAKARKTELNNHQELSSWKYRYADFNV